MSHLNFSCSSVFEVPPIGHRNLLSSGTSGTEADTIFHNVAYLGSAVVHNPKDEAAIKQHMAAMNKESTNPLQVTVSVPRSPLGSVEVKESATRTGVGSFQISMIIFFARGEAYSEENSCFAFTSAHGETAMCHVFRCKGPEAVSRIFVSFAKAFKRPQAFG